MSEMLSYGQFLKDREEFRKSGARSGEKFNYFDTPSNKFFKILFYFGEVGDSNNGSTFGNANGLLAPTWEYYKKGSGMSNFNSELFNAIKEALNTNDIYNRENSESNKDVDNHYYMHNSAWAYLMLNDEQERAEKLEKFVTLLSNINSLSPWYFTSISGLDSALERKVAEGGNFTVEEPKKLTITCQPDAFDNRIGTLLELYRDITWSWHQKKEIIPSNLRKFDMAIYIYEAPIADWHSDNVGELASLLKLSGGSDTLDAKSGYKPSFKMIEFHDCEINYNSIKSGWGELNNETGVTPKYSIDITYNDCYEESYNEFMLRHIGDVIKTDTYQAVIASNNGSNDLVNSNNDYISYAQSDDEKLITELNKRVSSNDKGFLATAVGDVVGLAKSHVKNKLKNAVLGNLYTYSLTKIAGQLSDLAKGKLVQTGLSVKQYIDEENKRKQANNPEKASGNLFESDLNSQQKAALKMKEKPLGNLFDKKTIANNI